MAVSERIADFKQSLLGMRLKELRHRFFFGQRYKRMIQARERFARCRERKPRGQMRREILLCRSFWRCQPLHYLRYNLYRRDRPLSELELIGFVPEFFFYQLFLPHYDSKKYQVLLTDKIITEQFFRSLGIAQPPTLAKLIGGRLFTEDLEETDFGRLAAAIRESRPRKLFVKPGDGLGGYGIHVFRLQEDNRYTDARGEMFAAEFLYGIGRGNDFIIQPGLEQDPQLSAIYPRSVNTFRVLSENRGQGARVLLSTLRIGRGGREVDNSAQDNIVVKVDASGGALGAVASTESGERFARHPDTGHVFAGTTIGRWPEVESFVRAAADKMPQFTYLGWDIALTPEGPLAIETNLDFGLDHYQAVLGGIREVLGIDDPGFYWQNRGKR
ncbi:MAG: hypothetical protein JXO51_02650 [Candidatus Aminicenantes bacterium]|nr:hypothetical protein [Candidatus Aminicenantes bacterium]